MWRNSTSAYGLLARALHWTIALLILGLIPLGWYITTLDYYDPAYRTLPNLHRGLGVLVLLLAVTRIGWAIANRAPPLAVSLKPWERLGALLGHRLLYLATLAIPLTGYLTTTSKGNPANLFGWFSLPALVSGGELYQETVAALHELAAWGTLALVIVHAAAALKHQFLDHDGTLARMTGRLPRD